MTEIDLKMQDFGPLIFPGSIAPTHELHIGGIEHPIVKILPDGRVILAEGITLDGAALAFWTAVEELAPGTCQRIIDARVKKEREP